MARLAHPEVARAIVVGLDSSQGLQTARLLAARGMPVIGIARNPDDFRCRTRACEEILYTDTKGDPLIETLERLGPRLGTRAVLVPCTDMSVLLISRARDRLAPWFHAPLPDAATVETLMDKGAFYRLAAELGLPIAPTAFLDTPAAAREAAARLRFPVILKPGKKTTAWEQHSKEKVLRLETPDALLAAYERLAPHADGLIAQSAIEGGDADLYTVNAYVAAGSRPVATFVARKLRQWPPRAGNGCLREEVRNDVVLALALDLLARVDYRGLLYVEAMRDRRSGEYVLIEVNVGRPTGGSAIAEAGGVELLMAMVNDALGRPLPPNLEQRYRGVRWVNLMEDVQSALHYYRAGELSLADWLRSWRRLRSFALLSWRDPAPMLGLVPPALRRLTGRGAPARLGACVEERAGP